MIRIYNLTEASAAGLALRALLGQRPYVLAIDPIFPPLHGALRRMADKLVAAGRARWAIELAPELDHVWEYPTRILLYDVFAETEAWQNRRYRFAAVDRDVPDYAMAIKQVTCNFARLRHFPWLLLTSALRSREKVQVIGLPVDSRDGLEAWQGRSFAPAIRRGWTPATLLNAAVTLAMTVYALGWIGSRLRLRPAPPEQVLLVADYMEDPKDMAVYDTVADGGPIVLVPRDDTKRIAPHARLAPYAVAQPTDGLFAPAAAMASAAMVLRDGMRLFRACRRLPAPLYYKVAALPWRRAVMRGFLGRYRPKFYWGRDDYNVEHVLRRQELHRVGARSFGINHGYPVYCHRFPMWRYVSFDRYYAFGRAVYERYLKDTWASDMEVVSAGAYAPTRDIYAWRARPRRKDIVFFTGVLINEPRLAEIVRGVAAAFPERTIHLQVKHLFVDKPSGRDFIAACQRDRPNVVHTRKSIYELLTVAQYACSDPSTVVLEALQFGQVSFALDVSGVQKVSILREFPGLCVSSAEELVQRIRAIESGEWRYPRESFGELVDLSGRVIYDVVREDMGLPVRREPAEAATSD
jgi:hypothetical protein